MEAQVYSAPFPMQQGFDLNQFMGDDFHELPTFQNSTTWNVTNLAYPSREPSVVALEPPKYPTAQEWDKIKPVFTKLYRTENRPLREVKDILERNHGFVATYGHPSVAYSPFADFLTTVSVCTKGV